MRVLKPRALLPGEGELRASLLIPAKNSGHALEATVREATRAMSGIFGNSYEIILIPNPAPGDPHDLSTEIAHRLAASDPKVVVVPHLDFPGKGAALQTGLTHARGKQIYFTDADLPYELDFIDRARTKLEEGYALVTGNRRLPMSCFNIPVGLLPIAYGRHRLGLLFNRVVRVFLPIYTTDTQAGIKAMSRELARDAFSRLECPGFFFDIEVFLTAAARGYRQIELPVTLFLNTEKSTVRIFREGILAAYWLARIALRQLGGGFKTEGVS